MELSSAFVAVLMTLFVLTERRVARACQCEARDHPQQRFCRADYAIIGRVVKRIEEPDFQSPPFQFHIPGDNLLVPPAQASTDPPQPQEPVFLGELPPLRKVQAPEEPVFLPPLVVNDGPHLPYPGYHEQRGTLKYIVQVEKVFRGQEGVLKNSKVLIQTDLSSSLCGRTNLNVEERYLISGSMSDGQLTVYLCDWVQSTTELTKTQRRGLRHFYSKYCDACQIETGTFYFPSSPRGRTVCSYNANLYGETDCEARFSSCVQRPNGTCGWYKGKDYKMCKKTSRSYGLKRSNQ